MGTLSNPTDLGFISDDVVDAGGMLNHSEGAVGTFSADLQSTSATQYYDFDYPIGLQSVTVTLQFSGAQGDEEKFGTINPISGFANAMVYNVGSSSGAFANVLPAGTHDVFSDDMVSYSLQPANPGKAVFSINGFDLTGSGFVESPYAITVAAKVEVPPVCFVSGTLIRTARGEIAVEALEAGDLVVTSEGLHRPIRWIGHRTLDCRAGNTRNAWPIRVRAGAFGENRPARDLYLSPQHAIAVTCMDEVLIPVRHLANGATIARQPRELVTYWHVELDSHDVILAENLPCESYLDTRGRAFFENGLAYEAAHPGEIIGTVDKFCRPLVLGGPALAGVRTRILARLEREGWTLSHDADLHLLVDGARVNGKREGSRMLFVVPASATQVRIASNSFVPDETDVAAGDGRRLGVALKGIGIVDGLGVKTRVAMDDPRLSQGFNHLEVPLPPEGDAESWRWTDGSALLPRTLWAGCRGPFVVTLELAEERGCYRAWTSRETRAADAREFEDMSKAA